MPAAGARLTVSPATIRLVFSEPVVANLSHLGIHSANGGMIDLSAIGDPRDVHALTAAVSPLGPGVYRVAWHVVSADGHPVSGSFDFIVGEKTIATAESLHMAEFEKHDAAMAHTGSHMMPQPMLAGAAVIPAFFRGLGLSALLSLCGLLGFTAYATQGESGRQRKLCVTLSIASSVLLAMHLLAWLAHISMGDSFNMDIARGAMSREVGLNELVRLALTLLAAWAVVLTRRLRLGFAFALAAVIAGGAIGHPAAIDPMIAIPMKALHLVAVAFWIGGILWIVTSDTNSFDTAAAASTVSSIALLSVVVVAITGIVQGFLFLSTWSELFTSAYGLTMLGKTAGLLALVLFGAHHRYRVMPTLPAEGDARFRSSLRRELVLMVAVIMLGGFLAYVPTPHLASHTGSMSNPSTPL